ncbi:hypothetical protein [Escherichia phage vB-Eco-KMB43]|nr:hypothetical protein [Escherichia phage vB-Eco-KMB43]
MKIEIFTLEDIAFSFMKGVELPIVVEGKKFGGSFLVATGELIKAGVSVSGIHNRKYEWCFTGNEARAITN